MRLASSPWQQVWPQLPSLAAWVSEAPQSLLRQCLVTGVHTGIGKTWVVGQLASFALQQGKQVTVLKPCQTGVLYPHQTDPAWVKQYSEDTLPHLASKLTCHVGVSFTEPAAPSVAAHCQGHSLHLSDTLAWVKQHQAPLDTQNLTLLEGAGGLLVPFGAGWGFAELAVALGWPVVVVTSPHLGHMNMTLLTLEALQRRGLNVAAVVINLGGDFGEVNWESQAVRRFPQGLRGYGVAAHIPMVVSA